MATAILTADTDGLYTVTLFLGYCQDCLIGNDFKHS